MPEPTIGERIRKLREALQLGAVNLSDVPGLFHSDKLQEYTERQKRLRQVCTEHLPAILDALERQREELEKAHRLCGDLFKDAHELAGIKRDHPEIFASEALNENQ